MVNALLSGKNGKMTHLSLSHSLLTTYRKLTRTRCDTRCGTRSGTQVEGVNLGV